MKLSDTCVSTPDMEMDWPGGWREQRVSETAQI